MKRVLGLLIACVISVMAYDIHWERSYKEALTRAKAAHKPIFFVLSSHNCKWCAHLERTTFKDMKVVEALNQNYINVIVYTDRGDRFPRELNAPGTPTLWFLDENGDAMFQPIEGAVGAQDLLRAVEIVNQKYRQEMMRQRYGNQPK